MRNILKTYIVLLLGLMLFPAGTLFPQEKEDSVRFDYEVAPDDSVYIRDSVKRYTSDELLNTPKSDTEFTMTKSPTTALIWSFVFPGLGQIYTEDYWKTPIFAGASGFLIYNIANYWSQFSDAAKVADRLKAESTSLQKQIEQLPPGEDPSQLQSRLSTVNDSLNIAKQEREFYRDNRDLNGLYLLGVYIFAAVDAYVGAHLFDFNVSEDLGVSWRPAWNRNRGMAVRLWVRF